MNARRVAMALLLLDLAFAWTFKVFIAMILFLPVILGGPIAIWREPRGPRLIKLLLIPYVMLLIIIPKPWFWPREILRRIDRIRVINPQDPSVIQAEREFTDFLNDSGGRAQWDASPEKDKLQVLDEFVEERIPYSYDFPNWGVFCHTATLKEVLEVKGCDDCQGRACVTVSLLKRLGFRAFCAETPFHWYTVVLSEDGQTWHFLNRGTATEPLILFDEIHRYYPWSKKPAPISMSGVVNELWAPRHNRVVFLSLRQSLEKSIFAWIGLAAALIPVSFLGVLFLDFPERRSRSRSGLALRVLWVWGCLLLAFVAVFFLAGRKETLGGCLPCVLALTWIAAAGADLSVLPRSVHRQRSQSASPPA